MPSNQTIEGPGSDGMTARQRARRDRVRRTWQPPPGPPPNGPGGQPDLWPGPGETLDYLAGDWRIFQRLRGHRYSTDDLLAAWHACQLAGESQLALERYLDLGAGIGSVAMLVAYQYPHARVVAIEAQARSAALFARSARYNGIASRVEIRVGDLRDQALYDPAERFELVTGSPPYLAPGQAVASPDSQRDACRFERRGGLEAYLEAASRVLAAPGICVLVHTHAAAPRIRDAARRVGLALWRARAIRFRAGEKPHIALYGLRRAPCQPVVWQPEMTIRDAAGQRSAAYQRVRLELGFPP